MPPVHKWLNGWLYRSTIAAWRGYFYFSMVISTYQLPRLLERGYKFFLRVQLSLPKSILCRLFKDDYRLAVVSPSSLMILIHLTFTNEFTTFISRRTLLLIESTLETSGPPLSPWQASRPPSAYPAHIISVKMSTLNILQSYKNEVSKNLRSFQRAITFWKPALTMIKTLIWSSAVCKLCIV